ncbi:glycosyltransferase family 17 protein [Dacryopinax primogenitus]|uniref:Glycosyltransferase family 17 protein n=1 Tax=Dacryopinax primogenitus (strain DJM 731) TaxID=1858805 RepID=M5FYL6_DACPD|nr:glycosyltransferase family 17 protein [Dacryopinax primogenitus]EJU00970.1 glycosyltransferase family 17 protein [Dacryopinax primogenitus]
MARWISPKRVFAVCPPTVGLIVLALTVLWLFLNARKIWDTFSYGTRPLWDAPDGPKEIIHHFYAEGVEFDEGLCKLHGWTARPYPLPPVWDAVMVSTELDLLEVRMHELLGIVDRFFLVESNSTFTGLPKAMHFEGNRARFSSFDDRISYSKFPGMQPHPPDPFTFENAQRAHMTQLLISHLPRNGPMPLVIFSDVDEIPSAHSIRLVQACQAPSPLHLQMQEYLYSLEWPLGFRSWRAQVHLWDRQTTYYRHSLSTNVALADTGFHCSYCFRTIGEFAEKMQGFSHADRLRGNRALLLPAHIQRIICEGTDIFNMLPEAYRFKDLYNAMQPDPAKSAIGVPRYLLDNFEKFRFLLPGGCLREE